nr:MAG TPA: hypothetical protein [Caudoviricetes sp.]
MIKYCICTIYQFLNLCFYIHLVSFIFPFLFRF